MSVGVLGATGFLGSQLSAQLLALGNEPRLASQRGGNVGACKVSSVDILDWQQVEAWARGLEQVYLSAGKVSREREDAEQLHRTHVLGTRSALRGLRAAGVKRVVIASTSGTIAVGRDSKRIYDERDRGALEFISELPYYRSKYFAEQAALSEIRDDFEVILACPSLLLGPGDLRESSTGDVRRFLERSIPALPQGGLAVVDVRDASRGMRLCMERGRSGERYLLSAANCTVVAFFERLSRLTGVSAPLLKMPKQRGLALGLFDAYEKGLNWLGGTSPVGRTSIEIGSLYWYCSSAKAQSELGFSCRDLGDTLRDTVIDLIERGVVAPSRVPAWAHLAQSSTTESVAAGHLLDRSFGA